MPGLMGPCAVWTKYSDAVGIPWSSQPMSEGKDLKPGPAGQFVTVCVEPSEIPRTRQFPAPTGFGRLNRNALPAFPEMPIGFVDDAMCCTSVGVADCVTVSTAVACDESALLVATTWNVPVVAGAE